VSAPVERVWGVVGDPHHFPRWWPKAQRVEGVEEDRWTLVLSTAKGRPVRMDFRTLASEAPVRHQYAQDVRGTPFERLITESVTQISLDRGTGGGTVVAIEQRQKLRGLNRLGGWMFTRATKRTLDEALERLEEAVA
jgi:uncharacterized protein YndB with AHSA1/START domain